MTRTTEKASCKEKSGGPPRATPVIEMKDVLVRFHGKTVLDAFSMRLFPREKVVLTGDSGLGKSTVLRCLMGFVIPDGGQILIHGQRLTPESVWTLRTLVAYVPQEPEMGDGLLREWFERPFLFRANAHLKKNMNRLPGLLERFSLSEDLLQKEVSSLSGGEKQRAALISALLLEGKLFLLDEPTSALDSKNGKKVLAFLFAIPEASILAVSHDQTFLDMADRTIDLSRKG